MTRRRYIQIDGELVEVGQDYVADRGNVNDAVLWNDRAYQDCGDARFTSRTQHRAYLRANNATTADDYNGEWARAAKAREAAFTYTRSTKRAEDVAHAYEMVRSGYKPRVIHDDD